MGYETHRNANLTLQSVLISNILVTNIPTEVKVGENILVGRKRIYIINDSSNVIYISSNKDFVPGQTKTIVSYSGQIFTFDVNPNPADKIHKRFYVGIADGYTSTKITILEVL